MTLPILMWQAILQTLVALLSHSDAQEAELQAATTPADPVVAELAEAVLENERQAINAAIDAAGEKLCEHAKLSDLIGTDACGPSKTN